MNKLLFCVVLILSISCDRYKKYDSYQTLKNGTWQAKDSVVFKADIKDTIQSHHVFLNVRTDNNYQYRNLFVISKVTLPSKIVIQDTLEYEMADAFGNWLGDGLTDVKNNKLFFLEDYIFPERGTYQFEFFQAMRKRGEIDGVPKLFGVIDVGLRIEESTK
ncbi:gliding motility-associated lipoprotein GldH [Wenyingzhuangia heitensis]|uniref:Gliding motility-associated lipoprotein GldH n=1 Tax=Wenyingzhuangia heitensis TaxID=1487859 RepID=A0ABX0U758_9FLAO|nr:gliding motility lipoprotein GldH [Wenyingzhuangia heitensis]NIJ44013.1 gliding motility-associated lipoprotein GldH [Wenyingzhuangia heitensis]